MVTALGGVPRFHHATLIPQAAAALAAEPQSARLPVLLVDEAHLLSHDQLEAIRMLTNADLDSASPLAAVLTGRAAAAGQHETRRARRARPADHRPLRHGADDPAGDNRLPGHHTRLAGAPTRCSATTPPRSSTTPPAATRARPPLAVAALIATYAARKTIADEAAARAAAAEVNDQ